MKVNEFYTEEGAEQLLAKGLKDKQFRLAFLEFIMFQPQGEFHLHQRITELLLEMEKESE